MEFRRDNFDLHFNLYFQSIRSTNSSKMLLRRELEAISMPFKTSSDSESDYRNGHVFNEKKKKKKTTKIRDQIDEINGSEQRERLFLRPGVIDEEPDSMDSIISDPSVFPITIVPTPTSGGGVLIRSTTAQSSVSRLSRLSSSSRYVYASVVYNSERMGSGYMFAEAAR